MLVKDTEIYVNPLKVITGDITVYNYKSDEDNLVGNDSVLDTN